jgi:hypothetical protein
MYTSVGGEEEGLGSIDALHLLSQGALAAHGH